ncbi:MAG: hypothetical protein ACRYG8_49300, partial [Janthinobacterium lividum]
MAEKVVRMQRNAVPLQVGGSACDHPTYVGGKLLRDHVLRHGAAIADAGIRPGLHHVEQVVRHLRVNLNFWITLDEHGQHRRKQQATGMLHDVDPDT